MHKYRQQIMEHIARPRNMGKIEQPDGIGIVSNPSCGDDLTIHIKVKKNCITDISFFTMGCGAAIAITSMLTELAKGMTLSEAIELGDTQLAQSLGLPIEKVNCARLGSDALKKAINNYMSKKTVKEKA